ncbi:MAG: hypothetical protein ACAI38_05965 [Myxococcota bacterium]
MAPKIAKATPAAPHITITAIEDPLLHGAARVVQNTADTAKRPRRVTDPSLHRLTPEALARTFGWLEERAQGKPTPLDKLRPIDLELITGPEGFERLQELDRELARAATVAIEVPLLMTMKVEAIKHEAIRTCGRLISDCYGAANTVGVLTIGELRAAWDEILKSSEPGFKPSDAFRRASADPSFTKRNVEALRLYMTAGLGGLTNHGSLEGHGVRCHRVFKLPLLDRVALPDNKKFEDQPGDKQREILNNNIAAYEQQFARTGYDRIYVRGDDNQLYVGLRDEGSSKDLPPEANLAFNDPSKALGLGATRQMGVLLKVVDVNNTRYEATIGFLSRTAAGWGERLNNLFRDVSEQPVSAITTISNNLKPDPKAPAAAALAAAGSGGAAPWFAAVGLAGLAAAIPNSHNLVSFVGMGLAGFAGIATGLSLWSLHRTGKDIGPFLDAIGHVVNKAGIRADEI